MGCGSSNTAFESDLIQSLHTDFLVRVRVKNDEDLSPLTLAAVLQPHVPSSRFTAQCAATFKPDIFRLFLKMEEDSRVLPPAERAQLREELQVLSRELMRHCDKGEIKFRQPFGMVTDIVIAPDELPSQSRRFSKKPFEATLEDIFFLCDADASQSLSKEEFLPIFRQYSEVDLTPQQEESLFESLDDNGNGRLSRAEFISVMKRIYTEIAGDFEAWIQMWAVETGTYWFCPRTLETSFSRPLAATNF
eukprot:m.69137 g.69137  ORF g.69137 m.69137 type:complete len:248 (+) comp50041_c0_seq2:3-746(+)